MNYDVIIVGGGLAGLTSAICLSRAGLSILVLEKNSYPHHKVCGEYVSNEVRPFLENLGLDLKGIGAVFIDRFSISNQKGKLYSTKLPLGGLGISRFTLDEVLFRIAVHHGAHVKFESATEINRYSDYFQVTTKQKVYEGSFVIGAYGKRSILDKKLERPFIDGRSPWLGVKGHYELSGFPKNEVQLHCFQGGYGGLSMTEKGKINFCYLVDYKSFQKEKNIEAFNRKNLTKNPFLKKFLNEATPVFESPLSIAQISFEKKKRVQNGILMCGDGAGLIHPLCGNGMAMAIHSGKLASEGILRFFSDRAYSRLQLEKDYEKQWKANFGRRLYFGRKVQGLITNTLLTNLAFSLVPNSELFLSSIIKQTHGKPILV